jgi:hypothetical protein
VDSTQQFRRIAGKREQSFHLIRGKHGVISVLNLAPDCEEIWGNGSRASHIYNLGTSWMCAVSILSKPCLPNKEVHSTHFVERCLGPTASLNVLEKRKISCPMPGITSQILSCLAHSIVTIMTVLSQVFPYQEWERKFHSEYTISLVSLTSFLENTSVFPKSYFFILFVVIFDIKDKP